MFKKVSLEIKNEILAKVKSGLKVSDLAAQYGLSIKTIYTWLSRLVTPEISFSEYSRLKRENDELKRIIGMMALDISLEKKRKISVGYHQQKVDFSSVKS